MFGSWVKKGDGIKRYKWHLGNSHGDVKYSVEDIVSNFVITIYGVKWVLDLLG